MSLYGRFFMDKNATIEVDKEIVLDVDKFDPIGCP